ncbi:CHAP domain-containing protein [Geomonas sp.]|uniref:CHAP domain-containing protein n=1 Tax=Geomonas sp. TaxID=2651584 RepID=UPI002B481110|nr:CHAP domain-containing protein [Geomonas sp.]HJV35324.1 CHAP domain-containing protein [Geomonas sp.]
MKFFATILLAALLSGAQTRCYAVSCNCNDWIERQGYCVDYVKERIPTFPVPTKDDMPALQNTGVDNITEGDVAIFTIKNYWHVAYVEKVHRDQHGDATAIDVSEMNFGDTVSFPEFRAKWQAKSKAEWSRALCCGVTENYDRITFREDIPLSTVKQVWSPDDVPSDARRHPFKEAVDKIKEVVNRLMDLTEREL